MFMPKFRDLVRSSATVEGTAPAVPGGAPAGFTAFADALGVGDEFYYCLENFDRPAEREVGRGKILESGAISREVPGGALTPFSEGAKQIALVAAADYFEGADASDVRGGVSPLPATPASLFAAAAPVELPRVPLVRADLASGINFNLTLQADTTLADPVNLKPGQSGRIRIAQDATGGRTLDFGPRWQFAGGPPVMTTAAGAVDIVAYFVNADGGVEASLLPGLDIKPVPLSTTDFQNGLYSVAGRSSSLWEMWEVTPEQSGFIDGSVISGVGWQTVSNTYADNELTATAAHIEALGGLSDGFTFVIDYSLDQTSGTKPRIVIDLSDNPAFTQGFGYYQNGNSYIDMYDFGALYKEVMAPGPMGDSKVAISMSPQGLSFSRNGEPVITAQGEAMAIPGAKVLNISCYTGHDGATASSATMRSLSIYLPQPPAMLESLSA